jgi:hypothetical protein
VKKSRIAVILLLGLACAGSYILPGYTCTIFTYSKGGTVLFGNNEDWHNRTDVVYFVPPEGGRYGAVYLGQRYTDRYNPQGGMNEMGLAFDANGLPEARLNDKPELPRPRTWIAVMMMEECATVEEAIELAKSYSWGSSLRYQLHLADAKGDAVVIGAGEDGELAFTRLEGEGFLVSTNFNLADPNNGRSPCGRYDTASVMLSDIGGDDSPSLGDFSVVLEAVAQRGETINTVYSNIFDLKNLVVHLYYFHQFEEEVTIHLREELEEGFHHEVIGQLFTPETRERAREEMMSYIPDQEYPVALLGDALLGLGLALPVFMLALVFTRSWSGGDVGGGGASGGPSQFQWAGFLRPNALKVVVAILLPALVALLVTRSPDSVLDFYWYLLTPMMPYYDGTTITRVFNRYVLLWVPFYLAACIVAYIASVVRSPARGEPDLGEEGESEGSQR